MLELIVRRGRTLIDTSSLGAADALTRDDEQRLRAFAASAATAVALAQSVESDRLRGLMAAADAERNRWARELHDETLQGLGALHLLLAAARRRGDARQTELAVDEAIEHIHQEIENLHAIISDLRPAALDQLGLRPALEALIESRSGHGALSISSELGVPGPIAGDDRLSPEVESTIYRLVQEALTNVVKHANARHVHVAVTAADGGVSIQVRDDGVGFSPDATGPGFGLGNMRERVMLAGGSVTIESDDHGTLLRAELPAPARGAGRLIGLPSRRAVRAREPSGDAQDSRTLAARRTAHPCGQLCVGRVLEHEAERTGVERLLREDSAVLHREHDDLRCRPPAGAAGGSPRCSNRSTCSGRSQARPGAPRDMPHDHRQIGRLSDHLDAIRSRRATAAGRDA